MKQVLLNFANAVLSKDQLKTIKGGYGDPDLGSQCSTTCPNGSTITVRCQTGNCSAKNGSFVICNEQDETGMPTGQMVC